MTTINTKRYQNKMADIRLMLNLIKVEADYAESWKVHEEIDDDDILELDRIIVLLTRTYGVFSANEDIRITEAIRYARDQANDNTPRHLILAPARQTRKVPPTWIHPKDEHDRYIPLKMGEPNTGEGESLDQYMPRWTETEANCLMMYETTSEGTPQSPVVHTPEELARWLAESKASWFGNMTATYEEWLDSIRHDLDGRRMA